MLGLYSPGIVGFIKPFQPLMAKTQNHASCLSSFFNVTEGVLFFKSGNEKPPDSSQMALMPFRRVLRMIWGSGAGMWSSAIVVPRAVPPDYGQLGKLLSNILNILPDRLLGDSIPPPDFRKQNIRALDLHQQNFPRPGFLQLEKPVDQCQPLGGGISAIAFLLPPPWLNTIAPAILRPPEPVSNRIVPDSRRAYIRKND